MTDEELIKALRGWMTSTSFDDDAHAAADRIEELKILLRVTNEIGSAYEEDAGQVRAKLAKAVEAIRVMMDEAEYPDEVWKIGSAVLAELEKPE